MSEAKCGTCKYNTNDFVCHPHCSGCNGVSKYEPLITKEIPGLESNDIKKRGGTVEKID